MGKVHRKSFRLQIALTGFLAISTLYTPQSYSKNYYKLLQGVAVGMDSSEVVRVAGEPTRTVRVTRWFYGQDQAVIVNDEVTDIRIEQPDRSVRLKRLRDTSKVSDPHSISALRIGMSTTEALEHAPEPNRTVNGYDLFYSNRHRVELIEGKVSEVDTHIKAGLDVLDWIRLNFSRGGLLFMNITLAFIMFGVALEIKAGHFKRIASAPKSVAVGLISQFIALPALTFALVMIIKPSPSVAMGMILVAACPGGNISNFISSIAKANVALSISLTAIATLSAIVLTPLNFAIWGSLYSDAADLVIPIRIDPWEMLQTVFILLGIPIALGIWFNHRFPAVTQRIIKPIKVLSFTIFIGFVAAALASNFKFFISYIHLIALIVFAHNLLALLTGFSLATLFKLPQADRRTLTIETGIQNSGLGLILIFNPNLFNGLGGMAFIAAWWGIWHIIAGLGVAAFWARKPISH